MAYFHGLVFQSKVGDDAHSKHLNAAMACHNNFGNGTHANGIAAQPVVHLIFGRGFECGTRHANINTVNHSDALFFGYLVGQVAQLLVVSLVHVGETRTSWEILSTQRMFGEEVDMVVDNHQIADNKVGVHAPRCVRNEERFDA